jgi:hypothetical protein
MRESGSLESDKLVGHIMGFRGVRRLSDLRKMKPADFRARLVLLYEFRRPNLNKEEKEEHFFTDRAGLETRLDRRSTPLVGPPQPHDETDRALDLSDELEELNG